LPFKWYPRVEILKSALAWRLLDLSESDGEPIDLVIATKFPSYALKHPNKVVWLVHQFRQVYDQLGTPLSDFSDTAADQAYRNAIVSLDNRTLQEAQGLFSISRNTSHRLARFNQIEAAPLYPPPNLAGYFRCEEYADYVFTASRLDRAKRLDMAIEAFALVSSPVRLIIAGAGPEHDRLAEMVERLNLADRVKLVGFVSDDELLEYYARCFAVYYAPFDEDYGYVTVEAFESGKPVVTTNDAGGVLEFVDDGVTGFVTEPRPEAIAAQIDYLWRHRYLAEEMGQEGKRRVRDITWDNVIDRLVPQ
jgi:glycosyltransferase involved in cell wall biosynthesis